MKHLFFLLSALVLFFSCSQDKESDSNFMGIASPVYLAPNGVTTIALDEYFFDPEKIDSVQRAMGCITHLSLDKKTVEVTPGKDMLAVETLTLWSDGVAYGIPVFRSNKQALSISIPKDNFDAAPLIKGEFNSWKTEPMALESDAYVFSAYVDPGNYQYILVVDGEEMLDPKNPQKQDNGRGGENSVIRIDDPLGTAPHLESIAFDNQLLEVNSSDELQNVVALLDNRVIPNEEIELEGKTAKIRIPKNSNKREMLKVYSSSANGASNELTFPLENGSIITDATQLRRTDFHTQVMYFLMVDRFFDGNEKNTKKVDNDSILPKANYYGGDLEGVLQKLRSGYFADMHINTIWLSPITQNPEGAYGLYPEPLTKFSGYHGYWPISNTKIDHRFGDEKVFRTLIDEAHQQGINVILDYVANHVHEEHPLYKEHPDWATDLYLPDGTMNTEKWDEHRLTTWFDTFMPTLDFSKPEVVEAMTDSAAFWVTNYELDGFRHDATKHINLEFWKTLTRKVKTKVKRPIYQIGETYGSPELIRSYITTGMLDAQFDFNLYDSSLAAFAKKDTDFSNLKMALEQSLRFYGSNHLMGNITGNQDKARFISYASGDVKFEEDAKYAGWNREIGMTDSTAYSRLALLHAFTLTTPGIPCIYYGDEYGSIGGNDPDNRKMMKFEGLSPREADLRKQVQNLIEKRRNSMALQYGTTKVLRADETLFVLERKYLKETVWIALNKSNTPQNLTLPNGQQETIAALGYALVERE